MNAARLFAEQGEVVHVVAAFGEGSGHIREVKYDGKLIIHRVPFDDWTTVGASEYNSQLLFLSFKTEDTCRSSQRLP